jgi:CheY-like chemotaxis protein
MAEEVAGPSTELVARARAHPGVEEAWRGVVSRADRHHQEILVVDDDPDIREGLQDLLEDEGFVVTVAAHGREALAIVRGGQLPSLILLDLMMPVMNGQEFKAALREDPLARELPVIAMTAGDPRTAPGDVACVIRKPLRLSELLAAIRQQLSKATVAERVRRSSAA